MASAAKNVNQDISRKGNAAMGLFPKQKRNSMPAEPMSFSRSIKNNNSHNLNKAKN